MAERQPNTPTHRAYSVIKRDGQDDYWLNVGLVFPHKDGNGFNIILQAFPLDGKIVCREITDDDAREQPAPGADETGAAERRPRREAAMTAERIRDLNDVFRRSFVGGKVMMTAGIAALPEDTRATVLNEVRTFDAFSAENDPHGEHDFGSFEVEGRKLFWKMDLYEEPEVKGADGQPVTTRVLTIMLAEEW